MPMVGIRSRSDTALASGAGTSSSTIAKAPAACSSSASSTSRRASEAPLPCTLRPSWCWDCGVKPRWPMTGTPSSVSLRTAATTGAPTLQLHSLYAGLLHQPPRRGHRVCLAGVGQEGQVADHQGVPRAAHHGGGMAHHVVQRDGQGGGMAVHDHAERVAHEQERDPGPIREARRGVVIGGDHGDPLASVFHPLHVAKGDWHGRPELARRRRRLLMGARTVRKPADVARAMAPAPPPA